MIVSLPDVLDQVAIDLRHHAGAEIFLVHAVNVASDDQPASQPLGHLDGEVRSLLIADTAEEKQVGLALGIVEGIGLNVYGVVDHADKAFLVRKQGLRRPANSVVPALVMGKQLKPVSL